MKRDDRVRRADFSRGDMNKPYGLFWSVMAWAVIVAVVYLVAA